MIFHSPTHNITYLLVCLGYNLLRSWVDPFLSKYPLNNSKGVTFLEICHVEFAFLSMAKSVFASNIRSKTAAEGIWYFTANSITFLNTYLVLLIHTITIAHGRTLLVFGGLMDLADHLRIPNKYTGYIFLLDKDNRVRWRASGQMLEEKGQCTHMYHFKIIRSTYHP